MGFGDLCDDFAFLSTLSLRRATLLSTQNIHNFDISIHALLAESDRIEPVQVPGYTISIHALLAESDAKSSQKSPKPNPFLSTLSLRRATSMTPSMAAIPTLFLSTLSLRRATFYYFIPSNGTLHFYPRSPCGERRGFGVGSWPRVIFLSTLSLRRATNLQPGYCAFIHLFLSTLSLRRATVHYDN